MARVLVADDEPKLGKLVAEMLELDGHAVVRVTDGVEALARLAEGRFDVVVTDLRMPRGGRAARCCARRAPPAHAAGGRPDDRARQRRERGGGDEGRRGGLPHQAVLHGRAADAGGAAGRAARARRRRSERLLERLIRRWSPGAPG